MMPLWSEDLSQFTVEEVLQSQDENRAWYKDVRRKVNALMDTKLAKLISPQEYRDERKLLQNDIVECERRARILANDALSRRNRKSRLVYQIPDVDDGRRTDRG